MLVDDGHTNRSRSQSRHQSVSRYVLIFLQSMPSKQPSILTISIVPHQLERIRANCRIVSLRLASKMMHLFFYLLSVMTLVDAFCSSTVRGGVRLRPQSIITRLYDSSSSDDEPPISVYTGPLFVEDDNDDQPMTAELQLAELGIDLAVGASVVSPGQLGVFLRCSQDVDSVTLPECTLLSGYANPGTFLNTDVGDKTVGFTLRSSTTAVFFQQSLMEVGDALQLAASEYSNDGACGLAGHDLSMNNDGNLSIQPVDAGFDRYFCPDLVNDSDHTLTEHDVNVQNFGQFSNDLAWDQLSPPGSVEEYMARSAVHNCVQLVWRLEYDESCKSLKPSWPVSVLSRDVRFENREYMELGTRYGWGYWQATVQLEDLKA